MRKILITGVGAIIGYGIIKSLRSKYGRDIFLLGMDIYNDAYGRFLTDQFIQARRVDDPAYLDWISEIIVRENIDLVFPGLEPDVFKLNGAVPEIRNKVVLNRSFLIELSKDKWKAHQYYRDRISAPLIPTLFGSSFEECVSALGLPFILKPVSSSASKGLALVKSRQEFDWYTALSKSMCIYQKNTGTDDEEYTVSVFGDGKGGILDHLSLRRKLSGEGSTQKAEVVLEDSIMLSYIRRFCSELQPLGPTNFQLRIDEGHPFLLEINPRISSACSIRAEFGYNEPCHCIDYFVEKKGLTIMKKEAGHAVRYIQDHFIKNRE